MRIKKVSTVLNAIIFSLLGMAIPSHAQKPEFNSSMSKTDQLRKEGQLVSVQISRGNPIRIFVVGREEAKIDPATMSLTVRRLKPYPAKVLKVDKYDNYFVVSDLKEFKNSKEIEIVTKLKGSDETFQFDLKEELP